MSAKIFGDWFKRERIRRGLTQSEAAVELQIGGPTVSRWEAGTAPRAGHLLRLIRWGKVSADKIVKMLAA